MLESTIEVEWFQQEKAAHTPRWLRYFVLYSTIGVVAISAIILYDFQLNNKGSLKKKSREFLQAYYVL